ncbi:MAG TPA: hypothetical protein VNY06_08075, partial [Methylocella sp.]|nr:hypothetical protein [Methylocella sp.]
MDAFEVVYTRIRRMTHKYVEGQVRFSYDNQWLIRALRLRSWRTRRVNRRAGRAHRHTGLFPGRAEAAVGGFRQNSGQVATGWMDGSLVRRTTTFVSV